jgi:hypothetical protein
MKRSAFPGASAGLLAACESVASHSGGAGRAGTSDAAWSPAARGHVATPLRRIACVERHSGPVALFLHGFPLIGLQWRGALDARDVLPALSAGPTRQGNMRKYTDR